MACGLTAFAIDLVFKEGTGLRFLFMNRSTGFSTLFDTLRRYQANREEASLRAMLKSLRWYRRLIAFGIGPSTPRQEAAPQRHS